MARNDELVRGAEAMASDFELPGDRRKKLARVVAGHLDFFAEADACGLTWQDISAVLAKAGIRSKNGLPLSVGTLSSSVWRKRREAATNSKSSGGPTSVDVTSRHRVTRPQNAESDATAPAPSDSGAISRKRGEVRGNQSAPANRTKSPAQNTASQRRAEKQRAPATPGTSRGSRASMDEPTKAKKPTVDKADVLGFMRRAAQLRRRTDDD